MPSFVRPLPRDYGPIRLLTYVNARRAACGLPEPARTRVPASMRSPRFRTKDVSTCMGSLTARGPSPASQYAGVDAAFSSAERDRHLGIRPVSQLNIQPVVSPVNASRRPSRDAAHHSGPGRLARPFPVGDLHLPSFASFPGALCIGSNAAVGSYAEHVGEAPESRRIATLRPRRRSAKSRHSLSTCAGLNFAGPWPAFEVF